MLLLEDPIQSGNPDTAEALTNRYSQAATHDLLRAAIIDLFPGKVALVSSFGADSAVLLHLVSRVDPATPVAFVDTGHLFPETIAYRDLLIRHLGLTNVKIFSPAPEDLATQDPENFLWAEDQDRCCNIRKVLPLARALEGYDAWISGRKRFQADTRASLPLFEAQGHRTKINPLANWSARDIIFHLEKWNLPRHPLVAKNYLSIGCLPCTSPVRPGEDARAGRWRGKGKVECGIHTSFPEAGAGI